MVLGGGGLATYGTGDVGSDRSCPMIAVTGRVKNILLQKRFRGGHPAGGNAQHDGIRRLVRTGHGFLSSQKGEAMGARKRFFSRQVADFTHGKWFCMGGGEEMKGVNPPIAALERGCGGQASTAQRADDPDAGDKDAHTHQ